jgi:16S rRNA C967 or C1407 C5-methylase (RsmB/RsmF family)
MPKFKVLVTRDITQSAVVEVEAVNALVAAGRALNIAETEGHTFDWTLADGPCSGCYLAADIEDVEEIVEEIV